MFLKVRQDADQLRAAELIASQPVVVLSGKGGCGKTEVVGAVISYAIAQINTERYAITTGCLLINLHCVYKNDTDVAHYNFNTHQPILVIFGRDVAERVCYQTVICYPTSPN